jgi:predicted enzyme involved in methoxymalonyl-ACP biosynthesis
VICRVADAPDTWDIDTWLMSCRVLGRGVEQAMLDRVASEARKSGMLHLTARYIPTAKNGMVADHYRKLGFREVEGSREPETRWMLPLADYSAVPVAMRVAGEDLPMSSAAE